jgi:hypothetical protein
MELSLVNMIPGILMVDFSTVVQNNIGVKKIDPKEKYNQDYDDTTTIYYKSHRVAKTDPITYEQLTDDNAFKFADTWDPYTGNRMGTDIMGPLYFNPISILQHIYRSKLNGLWIAPTNENGKFYEGYYGECVGAGENFEIIGRGIYPERYLFRLPIPNCYLKHGHKLSLITMGPILTDREICEIDRLLTNRWSWHTLYDKMYRCIGSMYKLKRYYDIAVSKNPIDTDLSGVNIGDSKIIQKIINANKNKQNKKIQNNFIIPDPRDTDTDLNQYINKLAVDCIRKM